ncbi:Translation regulatory factor BipA (GTPase) [Candidatus Babela massiliensis]|uniref:Large ribosomal subunit assembly factor BipA n=2 Tax=Candidatus Babela massiliensis TaxID=673862 RepID=V6DGG9_9BACT|nr:translational GTPase TypA [Candidatus Babela massiliensis]CDK30665.1 Translation regulatory factor BipA (GTPase) [Candidatus Babela massiliensis]
MTMKKRNNVRNIAIIAHVDHGKTTLVDKMLRFTSTMDVLQDERVMDSNDIERERGITILAKNTGVVYGDYEINIVDTPGHSDFSGEVERTLQMVEGFLLLVDSAEGVLPGTRFVLMKALQLNLKPIVLINKIDRKDADIERTESEVHDLFLDLAINESQLDFPVLYGSSKLGFVTKDPNIQTNSMEPLFEAILNHIPAPESTEDYLQLLVTNLDHSDFLGTIAIGRVFNGQINVGQQFVACKDDYVSKPMKITKIYKFKGLSKVEVEQASFGDIVAVTGFNEPVTIGTTLCQVDKPIPHDYVKIDEPTLSMYISVNDSPFCGQEGKFLTSRQIKERLEKELKTNVALRVDTSDTTDSFKISGRGQLHLGILLENMRREGFEFQVSAPEVIYKTINGIKQEPIEYLVLDVQEEHQGVVMEFLGRKKAEMKNMTHYDNGRVKIEFEVPSRGLLGFRGQFLTDTRGTGIANFSFLGYQPYKGDIITRTKGALVSMDNGSVTAYALDTLQERGTLFVAPGDKVYQGMIIGEHSRDNDLDVNPTKQKKLTNMRASGTDDAVKLDPPRKMDLETCMEWIQPDELIEVTPQSIRLRKKVLRASMRK